MVPVVYGAGPYDTIAPPKSYINVFDFKNVHELAEYLLYLDKNDTAYNEYFRWASVVILWEFLIKPQVSWIGRLE